MIRVVGLQALVRSLTARNKKRRDNVRAAVNRAAELIFTESQRRVPVDTGNLKASGRLEHATGDSLTARVSYGGTAAGYAGYVHETHPTRKKYLEEPARLAQARFAGDVATAIATTEG